MTLSIIVAMSQNGVIGKEGKIPWHLSEDLKRFKQITMGHPIVMGRKTYESIGKPLPGRENIVITRDRNFHADGIRVVHSLDEAVKGHKSGEEIFIIGGAEIYKLALSQVDKIYLTRIEQEYEGDTYFPAIDWDREFKTVEETTLFRSEKNQLPYRFLLLQHRNRSQ